MKRNSTIQPTSGTPHLSFAAAASKPPSTPTPTPPPQTTTTQTTQTSHTPSVTKPSSSPVPNTTIAASASTTTPSFIPSKAGPTPPASVSSNSQPQSPARASPIPSTTNGNYSAVAAKANNASTKRSQPPAATTLKSTPPKAVVNSAMASSGSPIVFGSINQSESESIPAGSEAVTFGSIPASKKVPKEEIISTPVLPTSITYMQDMHVSEPASYKPPPHIPHQLGHGQHSHRRTDSTSSGHGDTSHHFRAQVPPTISQASIIPNLGVPVSAPYPQRPPIKAPGGIGPVNLQPHHGHPQHTHIPQWSQPYYMPAYDTGYYQPMYQPPIPAYGGQPRPMATRPFNTNAPSFTPKAQPSKRITIINPLTGTEVTPVPAPTPSDVKSHSKPNNLVAKPEEDAKPIFTAPTKSIIKIVNPAEKEREERERKEKEEKARKEQEEKERLEREEKERIIREAKEAEERRIREEQEEKERLEALARAEQERKEREERERKEREERERKEKKEREEQERLEAEQKRKEEDERIAREKAEAEAKAKAEAEAAAAAAAAAEKARIEKERTEFEAKERAQKLEAERQAQEAEKLKQEHAKAQAKASTPTPPPDSAKAGLTVDLSRTSSAPSGASARIENFGAVSYPSHIQSPAPDGQGKFRYNRDFLMQFMTVCTDKPDSLPSLEVLGGEDSHRQPPGGSRGSRGPMSNNRGKPSPMGSFKVGDRPTGMPLGMRQMSGDARLNRTPSENQFLPRNNYNNNNNLSRPPSQRGSRGGRRGGGRGGHHGHQDPQLTIPLADIVPLEKTENAWTPKVNASQTTATISADEPLSQEQVARKVKGLLNKLTLEKFDSISGKIIDIANLSAKEDDGTTLKHCIQIIFEKATDEPNFGSVYARLCQKLMDKVSEDVKDKTVQGSAGGKLFRKYLLHRCQEEFVKGWKDKAAANGVSLNDKDGPDLMSDEYYIMMKAKRQGLGLIHFIGELFKLQMLTEKIMHECVKKLLANVKDPEEEETEGLCKLMTTVGLQLDRPEAKSHIDVYFARMTELTKNMKLASRIRFMVQDVIDLRANNWVNRRAASGPKTIAAIHEEAARQQEEKELMRRTASSGGGRGLPNRREQLNRGQSFRGSGDARHDHGGVPPVGADGWSTVATTMTKKAGDLSSFGNTSRSKVSGLPSLGPGGSVFGALNKSKREAKVAAQSEPRSTTITSANSFSALEGGEEKPVERRRLNLLPRSTPVPENEGEAKQSEAEASPKKTEEEAKRSIANTLKEFMSIKDMNELLISVKELDACYRPLLVTEFVNQSMEMKPSEVDSIADIFKKLGSEKVVSEQDFEAGFSDPLEFLPDTAIDVPNAFKIVAQLLEAAGMDPARAKA